MLFVLIAKKKELLQTVWDQIDFLKDSEFLCTVQEKCSGLLFFIMISMFLPPKTKNFIVLAFFIVRQVA